MYVNFKFSGNLSMQKLKNNNINEELYVVLFKLDKSVCIDTYMGGTLDCITLGVESI